VVVEPPLVALLSAAPNPTQVGEPSVLTLGLVAGVPGYTWTLTMNGGPNLTGATLPGTYTFTPTAAGSYTFVLSATDSVGSRASATVTVVVEPALTASLTAKPNPTQVGEPSVLTLGLANGVPKYTWTLTVNGGANLSGASEPGTYTFTPSSPGTYTFVLSAMDSVGSRATATVVVVVEPALVASLVAKPNPTQVGESSILSLGLANGVPPYTWNLTVNGGSNLTGATEPGTYTFTPIVAGSYTFLLSAMDAVGSHASATTTVVVEPALTASLRATPNPTQVGEPSVLTLGLANGVPGYTWTLTMNGGPNLTGATVPGTYTFTPTVAGSYTFVLSGMDAVGSHASSTVTVVVEPALTASLTAKPNPTQVGESSVLTLALANGVPGYTWTLSVNGGSNLTGATEPGTYTFTPVAAGSYTFVLSAMDSVGSKASATVTVVVEPPLTASLTATPNPTQVGESSVLTLGLANGVAPYTWRLTVNGGSNLTGATEPGTYTFTPTSAGSYTFVLTATDAVGSKATATVTVVVEPALTASLTAKPNPTQVGESSVLTLGLANGVPPYTWTLTVNGGSNLTGATEPGTYTFTPTVAGSYTFVLSGMDAVGSRAVATVTVVVEPALTASLTATPNPTQVGESSVLTLGLANGVPPYTWTLTVNGGPNVTGATEPGTYTFTPTSPGSYTFVLSAMDAVGSKATATVTVVVEPPLEASIGARPNPTQVGEPVALTLALTNGVPGYTWTFTMNGGANLSGVIVPGTYTFTPTAPGSYVFVLSAMDAVGSTATARVTVVVEPALTASLTAKPNPTQVGESSVLTLGLANGVPPYTWTLTVNGGSNLTGATEPGTYTFTPTLPGSYTFVLSGMDAVGSRATATVTVVVEPPLIAELAAKPNPTQVGESSVLSLGLFNGVPPYTWTLTVNGGSNLTGATEPGTYTFTPTAAGSYTFVLSARDSVGSTASASVVVVVEPPLVDTLGASLGPHQVGQTVVLSYGFSGGVAPITWTLTVNGSSANLTGALGGTYLFTPSESGTYTFYLNATDAVGSPAKATTTVVVVRPILKLTEFGYTNTPNGTPTAGVVNGTTVFTVTFTNYGTGAAALSGTLTVSFTNPPPPTGTLTCWQFTGPASRSDCHLSWTNVMLAPYGFAGDNVTFTFTVSYANMHTGAIISAAVTATYTPWGGGTVFIPSGVPARIEFTIEGA